MRASVHTAGHRLAVIGRLFVRHSKLRLDQPEFFSPLRCLRVIQGCGAFRRRP
jgi:hypothetical protein